MTAAIAAGYDNYDHIAGDSDFDPIRSDASFRQVMAEAPDHEKRKEEETILVLYLNALGMIDA